jgi:hypothetical protein
MAHISLILRYLPMSGRDCMTTPATMVSTADLTNRRIKTTPPLWRTSTPPLPPS